MSAKCKVQSAKVTGNECTKKGPKAFFVAEITDEYTFDTD